MFEAVYIADSNNNLVYEFLINLSSPSFSSLLTIISNHDEHAQHNEAQKRLLIEINTKYSVYLLNTSNITIYTLCSNEVNPMMPYVFINRLIEVIHEYFGYPLAIPKIESNNDTLTLLINQMLDNRIPNITDFNQLRDIVPFKSFLSKLLSKTNDLTNLGSATNNLALQKEAEVSDIPWRRSNVRYTNNEMYVDLTETINVVLKASNKTSKLIQSSKQFDSAFYSTSASAGLTKSLVPVNGEIKGVVNITSRLTGVPYLQMILQMGKVNLGTPSFHRCVKLEKWLENTGNLSFIPPDGKCTLMEYSVNLNQYSKRDVKSMLGLVNVDYNYGLGANKNEFEIKIFVQQAKSVSKIETVTVEIHTNEKDLISIKSNRITNGDFSYKGDNRAEWKLRNLATNSSASLYGSIITEDIEAETESAVSDVNLIEGIEKPKPVNRRIIKPSYLKLSYTNKGSIPSGLKVDSLKILSAKGLGDTVKPYKGVKYITNAEDFIVRS